MDGGKTFDPCSTAQTSTLSRKPSLGHRGAFENSELTHPDPRQSPNVKWSNKQQMRTTLSSPSPGSGSCPCVGVASQRRRQSNLWSCVVYGRRSPVCRVCARLLGTCNDSVCKFKRWTEEWRETDWVRHLKTRRPLPLLFLAPLSLQLHKSVHAHTWLDRVPRLSHHIVQPDPRPQAPVSSSPSTRTKPPRRNLCNPDFPSPSTR